MIIIRENIVRLLNPQLEAQKRDLKELITRGFSFTEQQLIVMLYYEEMTPKEIGITLGISESGVCQMHASLVDRLEVLMDQRVMLNQPSGYAERNMTDMD
jgi:DNA-directed RNA polymerase specialized sigma subunit